MLNRHVELSDSVCKLNDVDLDSVLLPASFERRNDALLTTLEELNDMVLKL